MYKGLDLGSCEVGFISLTQPSVVFSSTLASAEHLWHAHGRTRWTKMDCNFLLLFLPFDRRDFAESRLPRKLLRTSGPNMSSVTM
jgi:hypothetical protein